MEFLFSKYWSSVSCFVGLQETAEIASKKKIPLKFLENILLELKKAGLLESKKGKGGGYFFKELLQRRKTICGAITCPRRASREGAEAKRGSG